MKKLMSLLIAVAVIVGSFLPNTARATDPCAMFTVQASANAVVILNGHQLPNPWYAWGYNDGDTLVVHWAAGCVPSGGGATATLRAYVWAHDHYALSRTFVVYLAEGCESGTRILHGSASYDCTQAYCSASPAGNDYCPCNGQ